MAKKKSKHSEFYYKLQTMNDKISVYRSMFYNKMPAHQKLFLEKKQEALEKKLQEDKIKYEKEIKRKLRMRFQDMIAQFNRETRPTTGISVQEMIEGVRKKSSKNLLSENSQLRCKTPKRAKSFAHRKISSLMTDTSSK